MKRSAVSLAIEQMPKPRTHAIAWARAVDVGADRLEFSMVEASSATVGNPPIGTSSRGSRAGDSTPDLSLVAGISNRLTLDATRQQRLYRFNRDTGVATFEHAPAADERVTVYAPSDFPCSCIVGSGVYCYRHHRTAGDAIAAMSEASRVLRSRHGLEAIEVHVGDSVRLAAGQTVRLDDGSTLRVVRPRKAGA